MIKILLLEDSSEKTKKIKDVILINENIQQENIISIVCTKDARIKLYEQEFDLFITDLLVPSEFGDEENAEESISLLYDISNDDQMNKPLNIIGLTAYDDKIEDYKKYFSNESWSLVSYSESTHNWENILTKKLDYILNIKKHNVTINRYI